MAAKKRKARAKPPRKKHYTVDEFLRQTKKVEDAVRNAYQQSLKLKGMYDSFEYIEGGHREQYDRNLSLMFKLGKLITPAASNYLKLRSYLGLRL